MCSALNGTEQNKAESELLANAACAHFTCKLIVLKKRYRSTQVQINLTKALAMDETN